MLIRNMGLFWRLDNVYWDAGTQTGKLLGVDSKKVSSGPVDFSDQIGVYCLYAGYSLVYVGQVGSGNQRLFIRLKQHCKDDLAGRWDRFSWFGTRPLTPKGDRLTKVEKGKFHPALDVVLNHIEGILIQAAEPPLNGQDGRFGSGVTRFLQVRDTRLGATDSELLRALAIQNGLSDKNGHLINETES